jgi:PRTRC genetic system protein B
MKMTKMKNDSTVITLDLLDIGIPAGVKYMLLAMEEGDLSFHWRAAEGQESQKFVSMKDVAAAFSGHEADSGWIVPGVCRHGSGLRGEWYLYYVPPQRLSFNLQGQNDPLTLPMPALIFGGVELTYFIWALEQPLDLQAPRESFAGIRLCSAPFPNVSASGQICFGANALPRASVATAGAVWQIFQASIFSDHSVGGKSKKYGTDIRDLWAHLNKRKARHYPIEDLVQNYTTLENAVQQLMGARDIQFAFDAEEANDEEGADDE